MKPKESGFTEETRSTGLLIRYDRDIPAYAQAFLPEWIRLCLWLVPGWCQEIHIQWGDTKEDGPEETKDDDAVEIMASCVASHSYRWSVVRFSNHTLEREPFTRLKNVVHEFVHISNNPSFWYIRDSLETLMEEEKGPRGKVLLKEAMDKHEAGTQDIAHAIALKMWADKDVRKAFSVTPPIA